MYADKTKPASNCYEEVNDWRLEVIYHTYLDGYININWRLVFSCSHNIYYKPIYIISLFLVAGEGFL